MKTAVIIEARMESSRLPGKVLLPIIDKPAIGHLIERIKNVKNIDDIIVSTTVNKLDDELCMYLDIINIKYFRGSEDDVLDRVVKTADYYNIDILVEVTGDCQLTDYRYIEEVVDFYNKNNYDLVSNTYPERNLPIGLDVFVVSSELLKKINSEDKNPLTHEHLCYGIFSKPNIYSLGFFQNNIKVNHPNYHWTLDTIDDYKFIREIYKNLYLKNKNFITEDIINLLQSKPEILKINENVKQKSLDNKIYNVGIIGSGKIAFEFDAPESNTSKSHYGGIKQNPYLKLTAISDISESKLNNIKSKYNLEEVNAYKSYEEMIKNEKIDIIVISTDKNSRTVEMAQLIAQSDINTVIIEKPISDRLENVNKILDILDEKNVYVDYIREFMPEYEIMKLIIENKKVQTVNCVYSKGYQNNGSHVIDFFSYIFDLPNDIEILNYSKPFNEDKTYSFRMIYDKFVVNVSALDYENYDHLEFDIFFDDERIRIMDSLGKIEYYKVDSDLIYKNYKRLNLYRIQSIDRENIFKRVYAKIVSNLQSPGSFVQNKVRIKEIQKFIYR